MEELRRAAVAYYNNSSPEYRDMTMKFFESMDTNRDGRVNFSEFVQFLRWNGYEWVDHCSWFPHLDADRDGGLDFWDVLTFYYTLKTRGVWCARCHSQLHALYFTCVECFDAGQPFDVCSSCYGGGDLRHHHRGLFLDSYVLLRSKLGCPGEDVNKAITQPRNRINSHFLNRWLTALDMAFTVANLTITLGGCSVM